MHDACIVICVIKYKLESLSGQKRKERQIRILTFTWCKLITCQGTMYSILLFLICMILRSLISQLFRKNLSHYFIHRCKVVKIRVR